MELTGKLTQIGQATEGTSAKGPWRKAVAIFETEEQYPKTVAVGFFNAKLDEVTKIPLGSTCKVKFDIESREWNGKWYTNLNGYGIEVQGVAASASQPQQQTNWDEPVPPLSQPEEEQDDLPF